MKGNDLSKQDMYDAVKKLVETEAKHIHLPQQKLFTLFSIAFQYLLYCSTKSPGAYILRIEDSALVEKLSKKAKDSSTRRFLQSLMLPRKFKFQKSTFYLDFFHLGSWSLTSEIPKDKIKAALIVKNTSHRPMTEVMNPETNDTDEEESEEAEVVNAVLPEDYYLTSLLDFVPKTITIAYDLEFEGLVQVEFPFIKKEQERVAGFTVSKEIDLDEIDN